MDKEMKKQVFIIVFLICFPINSYSQNSKEMEKIRDFYNTTQYFLAVQYADIVIKSEKLSGDNLGFVYFYKGLSLLKMEQKYKAEFEFIESLKIYPGLVLDKNKFGSEAFELFERVKKENFMKFELVSEPEDADVHLNGIYKGKTPLTIPNFYADSYKIILAKGGYDIYEEQLKLFPGENKKISATLNKLDSEGIIKIITDPPGIDVYINSVLSGESPFIAVVPSGDITVSLKKTGYKTDEELYSLKENEILEISKTLKKKGDNLVYSILLPGLGQVKSEHKIHGTVFLGLMAGFTINLINTLSNPVHYDVNAEENTSRRYGVFYIGNEEVTDEVFYAEMDRRDRDLKNYEDYIDKKQTAIIFIASLYAVNVVDMLYLRYSDARKEKQQKLSKVSIRPVTNKYYTGLSLRFAF